MISNIATGAVFLKLGQLFPQVQPFGGGGGGATASSLISSNHKLWNFHRYWLIKYNYSTHIIVLKVMKKSAYIHK